MISLPQGTDTQFDLFNDEPDDKQIWFTCVSKAMQSNISGTRNFIITGMYVNKIYISNH